jgi:iron complex transport system ATP-binding protein
MMSISVNNVSFRYPTVEVLDDISFSVEPGDCMVILGKNGVGKSTLLRCINRILKVQAGDIEIGGVNIRKMNNNELAQKIGYVLQSNQFSDTTVFDAVLMGRKPYIKWEVTGKDLEIVTDVLLSLSLQKYSMRRVNELSGGEMQKVAIARALTQQPDVLMFDEPTSNLDLNNQLEVIKLIKDVVKEKHISAIVTMHDLNLALRFGNKFVMMKGGRIHSIGGMEILTPDNILNVYDVNVKIETYYGQPVVIPVEGSFLQ